MMYVKVMKTRLSRLALFDSKGLGAFCFFDARLSNGKNWAFWTRRTLSSGT
nr:Biomphalaria glabrata alpha-2B adrenergic receptor-like [Biomphalaria glabrata]